MPQRWHWLRLRTTCHPTEDPERVRQALRRCTGLEAEDFAKVLEEIPIESHHGGTVILMEVELPRAREVRAALDTLSTEDVARLHSECDARTDEAGIMHYRLSKQRAFEGDIVATTGDDAVHVRVKPEVHPASRDAAVAALTTWFEGNH